MHEGCRLNQLCSEWSRGNSHLHGQDRALASFCFHWASFSFAFVKIFLQTFLSRRGTTTTSAPEQLVHALCRYNKGKNTTRKVRSQGDPSKKFSRLSARFLFLSAAFCAPLALFFFSALPKFSHMSGQRPGTLPSPRLDTGGTIYTPLPKNLGKGLSIDDANGKKRLGCQVQVPCSGEGCRSHLHERVQVEGERINAQDMGKIQIRSDGQFPGNGIRREKNAKSRDKVKTQQMSHRQGPPQGHWRQAIVPSNDCLRGGLQKGRERRPLTDRCCSLWPSNFFSSASFLLPSSFCFLGLNVPVVP